ncbi:MAG: acylneuraminate cytidylyltransferase family protein [Marinomonas colpomeniae]
MSYVAFVPARSGSKRLPNKNIKILNGKPLLVWTLEACVKSEKISEVIFSTDSKEYWDLAKKYISSDKLTLDDRSEEEAGDKVKIFDYLKNSVDKIFGDRQGNFLMALPTMPLRTYQDVDNAISLSERLSKPVFSAVEYDFAVSFSFTTDGTSWEPVLKSSPMITGNTRSQDQVPMFHPNGAIYIRPINSLRSSSLKTIYDNGAPYIMSKDRSVDIDNAIDFKIAEILMTDD